MLVLSRKKNERITIGEDIHIKIIDVRGGKVRIGLEAPKGVSIWRDEVLSRIARGEERQGTNDAEAD